MKEKLTSRKLWAMLVGVVTGIGMIVCGEYQNGTVTLLVSVIGYLAAEGCVDVARIIATVKEIEKVADEVIDKVEE